MNNMALKSLQLMKQFRHDARYDIGKVKVYYIDRGVPGDISSVDGLSLRESDSNFHFSIDIPHEAEPKNIPYHRIIRIEYDGKCLFERGLIT